MKRILLACPTADVKKYCQDDWIEMVRKLTYPIDILIIENSNTPSNTRYLRSKGFNVVHKTFSKSLPIGGKLKHCLNFIRQYVIDNNYDCWFSLESDIFVQPDTVERLISHNKQIVSLPYFHYSGEKTKMLNFDIWNIIGQNFSRTMHPMDSFNLVDGTLKKGYQCGIGCMLIHRNILNRFPFRLAKKGEPDFHEQSMPDYYFHLDLSMNNVPVWIDTSTFVHHRNTEKRWEELFNNPSLQNGKRNIHTS